MKTKMQRIGIVGLLFERKLLAALDANENQVAILATKQDLEDMIAALYGYDIGVKVGNVLSIEAFLKRRKDLADGMSQLLREAFPMSDKSRNVSAPNEKVSDRPR